MTGAREDDDDALSWTGGENDPTLVDTALAGAKPPKKAPAQPAKPAGWRVVTGNEPNSNPDRTQMSSMQLLAHGILAGVYLIYTITWLSYIQANAYVATGFITQALHVLGYVLAVLAPAIWFGAVLTVTRGAGSLRNRLIALLVGAVILLPLPVLIAGA